MLPIVAIRPEPGCSATIAAGAAQGLAIHGCPLFEVRPTPWTPPPSEAIDGLLVGSANALRHGGDALARMAAKPVFAVGETTAAGARALGFAVAATGSGGLQSLLDTLEPGVRLLRLAGAEHVALAPPPEVTIDTRVVYASVPLAMPPALAATLRAGAAVLLHSGIAAEHVAAECARCAVPRAAVSLAALAPRIAAAAGAGWRAVGIAAEPTDGALLALAEDLCHASPPGEGR